MSYRIGIDVGGTFTDFFMWSHEEGVTTAKTLSTPDDPSIGLLEGLNQLAAGRGLELRDFLARVNTIVHGTTVTTNATLTRNGAKTGLLTTAGVRDALEMRRGIREEQYNNRFLNAVPLVPRRRRLAVRGRLDYAGRELEPLNTEDVRAAVAAFARDGVEAVAICFMNAFANPAHEQQAAAIVREALPGAYLSVSTEVLPTIRFYNRVSTTVLNSYVGPILNRYLESLTARLSQAGFNGVLLIMQSNGGVALPEVMRRRPSATLLSGPAGGPSAAVAYTRPHGDEDCILVDMGGTSFDASLVRGGSAAMTHECDLDRLRVAVPMLDIVTIGAGGGSIGWIDEGGLLRMGPQSAGAKPGPACYGRSGELPTCTDANVVLGYLDPESFAGGSLRLRPEPAAEAIRRHVAEPLSLSVEDAAVGMYRVINTNMAHGVREITVKRGLDPREFPLVVAGGAGALHGCMIAAELEMPRLVVPPTASVLCATGMLMCDLRHDYVRTCVSRLHELDPARLRGLAREMMEEGAAELGREGVSPERMSHQLVLDLRYLKQYHEVAVAVPLQAVEAGDYAAIGDLFHGEHNRLYGYDLSAEGTGIELINVRLVSRGCVERPTPPQVAPADQPLEKALKGTRRAWVPERRSFANLPVYDAGRLAAGHAIEGPALIERADTTIVVTEGFRALIDHHGSCLLTAKQDRKGE
ncbi:MAG: hydantoinase/oxoprolinase family protein [Planctomycetota bacterium]|nr:hydantoinase/oxoprolinase family protein [Planctomycetota bacterium]